MGSGSFEGVCPKFKEGNALKKTIQLPIDREVNEKLIQSMIKASLANLKD